MTMKVDALRLPNLGTRRLCQGGIQRRVRRRALELPSFDQLVNGAERICEGDVAPDWASGGLRVKQSGPKLTETLGLGLEVGDTERDG